VYVTEVALDVWLGKIGVGMEVVDVIVYEPVTAGSNQYNKTKEVTPVLVADLRLGPTQDRHTGQVSNPLEFTEVGIASRDGTKLYELSVESKQLILAELLIDGSYVADRLGTLQDTQDSSGGAWACKHCTYVNVTAKVKCGVCSKSRNA
jgi:hypothetical protein